MFIKCSAITGCIITHSEYKGVKETPQEVSRSRAHSDSLECGVNFQWVSNVGLQMLTFFNNLPPRPQITGDMYSMQCTQNCPHCYFAGSPENSEKNSFRLHSNMFLSDLLYNNQWATEGNSVQWRQMRTAVVDSLTHIVTGEKHLISKYAMYLIVDHFKQRILCMEYMETK